MPYQCLKCGTCFAEGTTTILRGCPDCHGTRFFFTETPLTQAERDQRLQHTEREAVPALLEELARRPPAAALAPEKLAVPAAFQAPQGESRLLPDGSLVIKITKPLEQRLRRAATGWDYDGPETRRTAPVPVTTPPVPAPPVPATASPAAPETRPETATPPTDGAPETVRIEKPGEYEIDVRRLLEKSPIVVQKDGTYLIHLPSLFEMPGGPKQD